MDFSLDAFVPYNKNKDRKSFLFVASNDFSKRLDIKNLAPGMVFIIFWLISDYLTSPVSNQSFSKNHT